MEDDQADTLAGGDVSKFSELIDWSSLAAAQTTPEPQPTGYSTRWYVSRLSPGAGQVITDGSRGQLQADAAGARPALRGLRADRPTSPAQKLPLTWILHSLEVNYNQYGGDDPQLIQQLCQDRDSICATTEGFGPAGWYYNEAETDFWQVWRSLADSLHAGPRADGHLRLLDGRLGLLQARLRAPRRLRRRARARRPGGVRGRGLPRAQRRRRSAIPRCAQDGQSRAADRQRPLDPVRDRPDLRRRARAHAPACSPRPRRFDALGQRYDLFIHTGADHLGFAVEDRFSDAVAALGNPVRQADPGAFTYRLVSEPERRRAGHRRHRRLLAERPERAHAPPTGRWPPSPPTTVRCPIRR